MGVLGFLKDTRGELKHVSWPTRIQTMQHTAIVIVLSLLVALLLFFYDQIFQFILKLFI